MSEHVGYVVAVKTLRPHANADRMKIATFFGNDTCVSIDTYPGEIGIYFPSDLQLSEEFCDQNHLCRKTATGEPDTGYLDRNKRKITAINLRGEKSDGLFMPIQCLVYTGVNLDDLSPGDIIDIVNGHEICHKYTPWSSKQIRQNDVSGGNCARKKNSPIAPLFIEHTDTEQLAYNLGAFKSGDEIEITLKIHGISQRTGYLPILKKYKRSLLDRILRHNGTPIYNWGYISGTCHNVLNDCNSGSYGSNKFREQSAKFFEGKLHKGEEVFYEVVGFTDTGASIVGELANKKLNDKDFIKQYGETTIFSYGCTRKSEIIDWIDGEGDREDTPIFSKQFDIYVYRMIMINEDGVIEYTPDFMRYRCEQMGVKAIPVMYKGIIPEFKYDVIDPVPNDAGKWVQEIAETFYDGPDPIGKTHIREGVVVRILNRPKFCAYKHKNWSFKVLEGIMDAETEATDLEEVEKFTAK